MSEVKRYNTTLLGADIPVSMVDASDYDALAAECERLRRFETAYIEWQEKTEWVQADSKPKELGKHRADVLRERIEALSVNHRKSGFCGDPYVHDCGRSDCPLSDSFKAQGK